MKMVLSFLFVVAGLVYMAIIAHADPAPLQAAATAAVDAAAAAAVQSLGQSIPSNPMTSGSFWATIATMYGAFNLIMSGVQQFLGLGARSSNKTLQAVSAKALTAVQHVTGNPDVSVTPPKG